MTVCQQVDPLLPMHSMDVLDDDEQAEISEHLLTCESCRDKHEAFELALSFSEVEVPTDVWEGITAALDQPADPEPAYLRVVVACTFCHAAIGKAESLFCAECMAPHHQECFEDHGRCSAPGCSGTRVVAPRGLTPKRRLWLWSIAIGIAALAGAAAWSGSVWMTSPRREAASDLELGRARVEAKLLFELQVRARQMVLRAFCEDDPTQAARLLETAAKNQAELLKRVTEVRRSSREGTLGSSSAMNNRIAQTWGEAAALLETAHKAVSKANRTIAELTSGSQALSENWPRLNHLPVDQGRALGRLFDFHEALAEPGADLPFRGGSVWNPDTSEPPAWAKSRD